MAREKELFRDNLVRLDAAFPGRELLPLKEAAKYAGIPYKVAWADKTFPKKFVGRCLYVPKAQLASYLS